jgi:hypothetical protein
VPLEGSRRPLGPSYLFRLVTSLTLLVLGAGCYSAPGRAVGDPIGAINGVTYEEPVRWYHHVCFWTKPLPRAVVVRKVVTERLATGSLRVIVEVRNNTTRDVRIDYKTVFFDAAGTQLERTPWTLKTLAPRVEDQLSVNSVGSKAQDFHLHIRRAQ